MSDLKFRVSRDQGPRTTYYQHDDRDERIVKFKSNGNGGGRRRRRDNHLKQPDGRSAFYDEEGDVQMDADIEPSRKSRFVPYEARGGFSRGKNRRQQRRWGRGCNDGGYNQRNDRNSRSNSNWFRIVIPKGNIADKNTILKILAQKSQVPFIPFNFVYEGNYAIFHVEGRECAKAIERLNGEISFNGIKMTIKIYPSSQPPEVKLDDFILNKIKEVMSKRCNMDAKTLDLSSFVNDIDLKNNGIYISLNRQIVFSSIIELIEGNIPDLVSLNLTDNKLTSEQLRLLKKLKNIKCLLLGGNNLRSLNDLDSIKELSLEELVVSRNPLCDHNKDQAAFVSAVRQKFPKVVRLDGQELPPAYGFDVEPETILPTSQGNFFSDETVRGIVPQFLEQYFTFYDSGDRQNLLAAYHDQAVFSMSAVSFLKGGMSAGNTSSNQFQTTYIHESRNLLIVKPLSRRQKLLRQGKISIISYLCQLPKTQHDPMSFSIDVPHFSNSLLTVSCSGVFKEVDSKPGTPIRAFSRVFILVPQGAGFCIINEMLFVTHATSDQAKTAFKVPAPTPSPSPVPPSLTSAPSALDQEQMVLMFSQSSGMNIEWSTKCLQENDWDFHKSANVFQEYNTKGQIPPAAFIKSI
uniref:NTF2 domain-containing protein n=1 Tax=Strigamia maritima TaxID=126957 RepID=T1JGC8_STRMM